MMVQDPSSGQTMQVTVPPGLQPGSQFQVQFPAPKVAPQPVVAQQGQVVQVQGEVVHSMAPQPVSAAQKRCRGCGVMFTLDAKTNPASAAAFRCKKCRGFSFSSFF